MGLFHHVGTFLLFAAFVVFLVASISAPTVNSISMLHVDLHDSQGQLSFGTFGYCTLNSGRLSTTGDVCSGRMIGYNPMRMMENIDNADYGSSARGSADSLTGVMIIQPIVCGLAFIAFALNFSAGVIGGLVALAVTTIAAALSIVAMATAFFSWGIVRNHVNGDGSGSSAWFGVAIWCVLAGCVALILSWFVVLLTCCSRSKERKARKSGVHSTKGDYVVPKTHKRSFSSFFRRKRNTTYSTY